MCHRVVVNVAMAWEHGSRLPVNPGSFPPKQDTKHPQYSTCPCCIARISSSLEHVLVRVLMHADSAIWTHRQRAADGRPRYACEACQRRAATSISPSPPLQTLRYLDDEDVVRPWQRRGDQGRSLPAKIRNSTVRLMLQLLQGLHGHTHRLIAQSGTLSINA